MLKQILLQVRIFQVRSLIIGRPFYERSSIMTVKIDDLVSGESKWDQKQNANNHALADGVDKIVTDTGTITDGFTTLNGFQTVTDSILVKPSYRIYETASKQKVLVLNGSVHNNGAVSAGLGLKFMSSPKEVSDFFANSRNALSYWWGLIGTSPIRIHCNWGDDTLDAAFNTNLTQVDTIHFNGFFIA